MKLLLPLASLSAVSAIAILKDAPEIVKDQIRQAEALLEDFQNNVADSIDDQVDYVSHKVQDAVREARESVQIDLRDLFPDAPEDDADDDLVGAGQFDLLSYDLSNYTIYELISKSNHTKRFSKIVDRFGDVVKVLNATEHNHTLFVPTDEAFEHLPSHKKPSDDVIEDALFYHIGKGSYPAGRILATHTLPTELNEKLLGGNPQRLRTSVGLSGVRINLYSKVVAANIRAKNGWIHAVNRVLVPPTAIGRELSFFPAQFSTLLLAYDKTNFVKYVHGLTLYGSTVFAPSNKAWERLGPAANAFLFNTEKGKKYLTALLKYQIVPNTTLYSDEIYHGDKHESVSIAELAKKDGHVHFQLPTLLKKDVSVDIYNWRVWTSIVLNGAVKVGFLDGIGKNGVIQVVEDIPVPSGKAGDKWDAEMEVEELKRRLAPYVDAEDEEEEMGDL